MRPRYRQTTRRVGMIPTTSIEGNPVCDRSTDPSQHDTPPGDLASDVRDTIVQAHDHAWDDGAVRTIARMLIERRDLAERAAITAREHAARMGWAYSLNAEQAEGSHAAYVIACAIVSGAFRTPIDKLAAFDGPTQPDLFAPDVPVIDLDEPFRPVGERGSSNG